MNKKIKNNLFGFILGVILVSLTTVYAANKIYATNVIVDTSNINDLSNNATLDTALTELYIKNESATCPDGYKCYERKMKPEVGDYIKMTPTLTSYTTDTSKTGYTSSQTINPSELNLWRVIKVNDDGTIDMVSENISTTQLYFSGQTGYKNLVGYLNVLANQYKNSKYTINARHMGYNGQTEYLEDISNTVDSTDTKAPWECNTGESCKPVEKQGGGDDLYTNDVELVKSALGTLVAKSPTGIANSYWLAGRYYKYNSSTKWYYQVYNIDQYGKKSSPMIYYYYENFKQNNVRFYLRPIVTLKSDISYKKALGTIDDPFILK